MRGRKQRSAIDAVITLTHDIELAKNQGNTLSCLMLDVKEAFDYISVHQLLTIMHKLQLSKEIQTWTEFFLQKQNSTTDRGTVKQNQHQNSEFDNQPLGAFKLPQYTQ